MSVQEPEEKSEIAETIDETPATGDVDSSAARNGGQPREIGGRGGLDPTRYGDWEKAGRCIDF